MKKTVITKKKLGFAAKIVIIVVTVLSVVFIATSLFSNVTLSNIADSVKAFFLSLKRGPGYPYELSMGAPEKTDVIGSYLVVVDDSNVVIFSKTAKEILRHDTTYTNPDMKVSNKRSLVYNRGTSSFLVFGQSDLIYDSTQTSNLLTGGIITASIGKKSNFAFGTWSDEGTSKFTVLNKKLGVDFYYVFGKDRILYTALSDNGKLGVCAVFGVENASYYSKVYIFDFKKAEPIHVLKYTDETVISVEFINNKSISIVTDNKRRVVSTDTGAESNTIDYSTHSLNSIDFDSKSKKSAVCYAKYGSTSNVVYGFDKKGRQSFCLDNIENVKDIECNSKYVAVLTGESVLCYDYKGRLKSTVSLTFNIDSIEIVSKELYLFSGSKVYKVKIKGDPVLTAG